MGDPFGRALRDHYLDRMGDPFGRALRDHYLDRRTAPLIQRDGSDELVHPIEELYFEPFDRDGSNARWLSDRCNGPLLDVGAGVGRHTLAFQDRFETVALEVDDHLVETMRDRGVDHAVRGDLFSLTEQFPEDRFETVLAIGTQAMLATSDDSLAALLSDLATVTTEDATVVLDSYDPTIPETRDVLGFRDGPSLGVAFRVFHFEYEGDLGPTLRFRMVSPERLADVARGSGWEMQSRDRPGDETYYRAALQKN